MNKLTKLYLITPVLLLLPMSVMATGYWTTPDGKDHRFDGGTIKSIDENREKIRKLTEEIRTKNNKGIKGDKGDKGDEGGGGMDGEPGKKGDQGKRGYRGDKGDRGAIGLDGDSLYADTYGSLDLLSVMAMGDAISNMPAPTSNGFFTSAGFSDLGGKNAGAIGLYYVDDIISYKVTYGHSGHERSFGFGIGVRL